MKAKSILTISAFAFLATLTIFAMAAQAQDLTLSAPIPQAIAGPSEAVAAGGDQAEIDAKVTGTALDYSAVLLNVGAAAANNLFIKVQNQDGDNLFEYGACYTGNNSGSFGLGFFSLTQGFNNAHMKAVRTGTDVTITFSNVDGGSKANQTYVCTGAPAAEGAGIGVAGYGGAAATIDNFSAGAGVLDTFSFNGALGSTANWTDINPGLIANGATATSTNGNIARSVWKGVGLTCTLDLGLTWNNGTLTMNVTLGANQPTTFNLWAVIQQYAVPLFSALQLPVVDPPVTVPVPIQIPNFGQMGVLTTLSTPNGIACSAWKTIYTGPPAP